MGYVILLWHSLSLPYNYYALVCIYSSMLQRILVFLFQKIGIDYSSSPLGPPSLSFGVCLPSGCSDMDIDLILYKGNNFRCQSVSYASLRDVAYMRTTKAQISCKSANTYMYIYLEAKIYIIVCTYVSE